MQFNKLGTSCPDCRLADLCLPYGLPANEVMQLANIVRKKRPLKADEHLYLQGEECQSLYAIKSGSFRSYITNPDGSEQIIGFNFPGELMGIDSLYYGRFTSSAVALETGSVCELPLPRLNALCAEFPGLQSQVLRVLGKEIAADRDKIVLLGHRSAQEKISIFLLMLSKRYGALGFSEREFNLPMRRQDIANFLGLTIETVSRQLAELNKQGIVRIKHRNVEIKDPLQLKALVEPCHSHCSSASLG